MSARAWMWGLVLLVTGCRMGGDRMPAEMGAGAMGLRVEVSIDRTQANILLGVDEDVVFRGEVIAVQPDGLLLDTHSWVSGTAVRGEGRLHLVAFPVLAQARIQTLGAGRGSGRQLRTARTEDLDYLRQWSRYRGAVDEPLLEQLRQAYEGFPIHRLAQQGGDAPQEDVTGSHPNGDELEAFLQRVRDATTIYQDRREAIRNGYRRLGPDFPGMGEHWVHPGRIVRRTVVPEEPPVLSYVLLDGEPVLTGVAFAVPLRPGEHPPPTPVGDHVWHDHASSIDEEALLLDSPSTHAADDGAPRLAMFHAWLWLENPDGVLAQNNWALPYVRTGYEVPADADPEVARALSLLHPGTAYYGTLLRRAARAEGRDRGVIRAEVATAAHGVEALVARHATLRPEIEAELAREWTGLWERLESALSPPAWDRLSVAAAAWRGEGRSRNH